MEVTLILWRVCWIRTFPMRIVGLVQKLVDNQDFRNRWILVLKAGRFGEFPPPHSCTLEARLRFCFIGNTGSGSSCQHDVCSCFFFWLGIIYSHVIISTTLVMNSCCIMLYPVSNHIGPMHLMRSWPKMFIEFRCPCQRSVRGNLCGNRQKSYNSRISTWSLLQKACRSWVMTFEYIW